jgi:hypothetical protein
MQITFLSGDIETEIFIRFPQTCKKNRQLDIYICRHCQYADNDIRTLTAESFNFSHDKCKLCFIPCTYKTRPRTMITTPITTDNL